METFFREHGKVMLIGLAGVMLGVVLNTIIRKNENKAFLKSLTEELHQLEGKSKVSALTMEEDRQMDKLKSEIYIMKFRCAA